MYNTMRISGLASGIDTEEMIQSIMRAERVKVDRVEQDRQVLLWRQEAYNNLNKSFANFILNSRKEFGLTSITYNGTFKTNSYQNLNWIKKATSSNEAMATVSSTARAIDGSYSVEVKQLAEGVAMASGEDISGSIVNEDGKIVNVEGKLLENLEFTINDGNNNFKISFSDKKEGITMNDVVNAINSTKVTVGEWENAKEVPLNMRASYDHNIGRFFLQTTRTGKDAEIKITTETDEAGTNGAEFIKALKLQYKTDEVGEDGKFIYKQYESNQIDEVTGKDAIINFSGADNITSSSNRITINGITMDLNNTGEFIVNVGTDVDGIYEKVKEFIDDYNELVEKTNKLLSEERYRDYRPLTAEQKKAMEENDIKLWEEKAKSGLLRSDDLVYRTMLKIRQSIYDKFEAKDGFNGKYELITQIGISTEEYARGSAGGKLVIDEQKFKKAVADDPDAILELLFKESTPEIKEKKDKEGNVTTTGQKHIPGGLISRIHDNLMLGMEDIIKKSGTAGESDLYRSVKGSILLEFISGSHSGRGSVSLLDKDILDYSSKIDDLNVMLFRKENHYYAKFAAMEKAISRMNQQSAWMMQQFMG